MVQVDSSSEEDGEGYESSAQQPARLARSLPPMELAQGVPAIHVPISRGSYKPNMQRANDSLRKTQEPENSRHAGSMVPFPPTRNSKQSKKGFGFRPSFIYVHVQIWGQAWDETINIRGRLIKLKPGMILYP